MKFDGDGPWQLPIAGYTLRRMLFAMPLALHLDGGEHERAMISLPGPFELTLGGGEPRRLDPDTQTWEELAVLFALRDERIERATVTLEATFHVEFASGSAIAARSEGRYEAWEVEGPGYKVVGTPGCITVWDEDTSIAASSLEPSELGDLLERWRAERQTG